MKDYAVSVIVPAYNKEAVLIRCIDSLIYQTLENVEIILVDDFSTDNSWNIMQEYRKRFPEKVRVIKSEEKGGAYAKNAGLEVAKGEYIAFLEPSDYMDYRHLYRLYSFAQNNDFPEMIYAPLTSVSGKQMEKNGSLEQHENIEDYLKNRFHVLQGKLFRADVFTKFGRFPLLSVDEERCFVFTAISCMKNIAYIPTYGYYHEQIVDNNDDKDNGEAEFEELIRGAEYILEKTNPIYQNYGVVNAFLGIYNWIKSRQEYADLFYRYMKEKLAILDEVEELEVIAPELFEKYIEVKEYGCEIPRNIYLNGFAYEYDSDALTNVSKAFRESTNIVILKEVNCDLKACPATVLTAYQNGNMDFVGKYFALKACYEKGGVFIDDGIEIDNPMTPMLDNPCFFGFESDIAFTDKIFGACSGNKCVKNILKTYEIDSFYEEGEVSLGQRIKTIMIGMYGVKMESCLYKNMRYGVIIYPIEMFVCRLPGETGYCVSHYKEFGYPHAEMISIPRQILNSLVERYVRIEGSDRNWDKVKKDRDFLKRKSRKLEKDIESLEENSLRLKKDIAFLKGKSIRLEKEKEFHENKAAGLEKDVLYLKDKSAGEEKEREFYKNKAAGLEKDVLFLKDKTSRLENVDEFYKNKAAGLEKDVLYLKDRLVQMEKEKEFHQNKSTMQKKDIIFLKNKSTHLEQTAEKMKKESVCLKEEIKGLLDESGELKKEVDSLKEKSLGLIEESARYKNMSAELEEHIDSLKSEKEQLLAVLQEYEGCRAARIGLRVHKFFRGKKER